MNIKVQLLHTVVVTALAALSAWMGLRFVAPGANERWIFFWTIGGSLFIWLAFGNLYLHSRRSVLFAVYAGWLSPFLGCLLVAPPYSFLFVFTVAIKSILLGIITSLAVWGFSSYLRRKIA